MVVRADAITLSERGAYGTVRLERAYAEVDRGRRVPDEDLRRVSGGDPVLR